MIYCPECGTRVSEDQRYCEQCGLELPRKPQEQKQDVKTTQPERPQHVPKLFDIKRNYYIIKEKMWDLGFGDIMDDKGQVIGKMHRILFSIRRRVELQELDGTVVATIHSKIVSARGAQDLKDAEGNSVARIKRKILTFFKQKFYLEEPVTKTRWYEAEGDFFGWSFRIYELATGKLVAEIEKSDKWRDIFLGGIFDFSDTYALKIIDNVTDRQILVGFVLSIDNVLHDNAGMGPGVMIGPGRRVPGPFGRPRRRF
jgi:uncharacterized protein YxjI